MSEFKDTYVEEVYNIINKKFKIGRVKISYETFLEHVCLGIGI